MSKLFSSFQRLVPDGLAMRFALLLVAALIAANMVALAVFSVERDRLDRSAIINREIERIITLVPIMEATNPQQRRNIAREASTRNSRISIDPTPLAQERELSTRWTGLREQLREALPDHDVKIGWASRQGENGLAGFGISVALKPLDAARHQWLNVVSRGDRRGPPETNGTMLWGVLGLSLIAVLGVGLIFVRLLTRPLRDLARAAKAAGNGDRTARVPETGAREMRQAASAFNTMQERIAQFDAERMRTMAAVGHDLRTPITSLRIRAEMLGEEDGAPMIRTLDEMTIMANGLVAFARGSADTEATQAINLDEYLKQLCADRGAEYAPQNQANPLVINVRPVAFGRAIGNLIDNAIRYGEVARVSLMQSSDNAMITIKDNGSGIAPDRIDQMFEPFVRGDDSRSLETGGAGLGLSIARSIITSHGGTLTLQNDETRGLLAIVGLQMSAGKNL